MRRKGKSIKMKQQRILPGWKGKKPDPILPEIIIKANGRVLGKLKACADKRQAVGFKKGIGRPGNSLQVLLVLRLQSSRNSAKKAEAKSEEEMKTQDRHRLRPAS